MAKQKKVTVNGTEFTFQSVSPSWYFEHNDECGMSGGGKRSMSKYVDGLLKNVVIAPSEIKTEGLSYFDRMEDISTPEKLIGEIESFLRG